MGSLLNRGSWDALGLAMLIVVIFPLLIIASFILLIIGAVKGRKIQEGKKQIVKN